MDPQEKEPVPQGNIPWEQRSRVDKLNRLAFAVGNDQVKLNFMEHQLNVPYSLESPTINSQSQAFKDAQKIQDSFESSLEEYLGKYADAFQLDAMFKGSKCYIFPESFDQFRKDRGTKPLQLVDFTSLIFYLGTQKDKADTLFNDMRYFWRGSFQGGDPITSAQLLAKYLN